MKRQGKASNAGASINELAKLTGRCPRFIIKRLDQEGLAPISEEDKGGKSFRLWDKKKAIKALEDKPAARSGKRGSNIDPKTGLTWSQLRTREQALQIQRKNQRAEKLDSEELMPTAMHHQVLSIISSQLEQLPSKARSELGLNDVQAKALTRMVDEARSQAAVKIRELKPKESQQ